jgi:hypothetical protein
VFVMANRVAQRCNLGGSIFNGRHRGNYSDSRNYDSRNDYEHS